VIWQQRNGNQEKNAEKTTSTLIIIINQAANFFGSKTIGENQRSVVSFFGPKVESSSLLPSRPKTATPVSPFLSRKNQNTRWKICLRLWSLSYIIFSLSSRLSHLVFRKIIPTFYFLSSDFSLFYFLHHLIFTPQKWRIGSHQAHKW